MWQADRPLIITAALERLTSSLPFFCILIVFLTAAGTHVRVRLAMCWDLG